MRDKMHYDYNRTAFRSVSVATGVAPLAMAYCSCVLLELSLKQHLGLVATRGNGGHDLPTLIQRLGLAHSHHRATCSSLQAQLSRVLVSLHSQGRDGTARAVPSSSYPYMRYLRHSSDWGNSANSDAEIATLLSVVKRITFFLKNSVGVGI